MRPLFPRWANDEGAAEWLARLGIRPPTGIVRDRPSRWVREPAAEAPGRPPEPAPVVTLAPPPAPAPVARPPRREILLQPRPLVLAALPYKRDDSVRALTRVARTGAASTLKVTYIATEDRYPLPFGADRGLLAWITTKGFATGEVRFSTIRQYFDAFQLDDGGRGYRIFRERFQRVANLAIRIEQTDGASREVKRLLLVPESHEPIELSSGSVADLERKLLSYHRYSFSLDPRFLGYLKATRIPTPLDLLRQLHDSPREWDFAQLVLFRCFAAQSLSVIPWPELLGQLGSAESNPRRLRRHLDRVLDLIRELHPEFPARFLAAGRGLEVQPWRPAMSE